MVLARPSARASAPKSGDRILIFKPQWLQEVLSGRKTVEVRAAAYKSGKYYFGTGGVIYCEAHLGHPYRVECMRQFKRHREHHGMTTDRLPYKNTWLIPILNLRKIKVRFVHPRGKSQSRTKQEKHNTK